MTTTEMESSTAVESAADIEATPEQTQAAEAAEEPQAKKARGGTSSSANKFAWKVTFPQCLLLRTFCDNIGNILTECHFEIIKSTEEDGFSGLSIESIDQNRVCLIQARLSGQVVIAAETTETFGFCVRMANLTSSLKAGHACHFVDMWQPEDSSDVVFRIYEPDVSSSGSLEFTLRTLAKSNSCKGMSGLEYALLVEIDLDTLRGPVKMAKEHKAEEVCFSVYSMNKEDKGGLVATFFVISYKADEVSAKFPHPSVSETETTTEGKPTVIRANDTSMLERFTGGALPPIEELEVIYSNSFGVEYLYHFMKGMEKRDLTLSLDVEKPLLLEYPMGGTARSDYIRFVLAPKTEA